MTCIPSFTYLELGMSLIKFHSLTTATFHKISRIIYTKNYYKSFSGSKSARKSEQDKNILYISKNTTLFKSSMVFIVM